MPDDNPLAAKIADEAADKLLQMKIAMAARHEPMFKRHVRAVLFDVLRSRLPVEKTAGKMASDEAWLASLERDPAMQGVDVRKELGKCQFWCKNNRRLCTRKTFSNWLLNADRVVTVNGAGQSSTVLVSMDPAIEPKCDWRAVLVRMGADPAEVKNRAWSDLSITTRADILKAIR